MIRCLGKSATFASRIFFIVKSLRTRIAPTPSGLLHMGNALSFTMTWALARASAGWLLLRIDDLDVGRRRRSYLEDIFRTLEWLGLDYDAGPSGPDDFLSHYSQHLRMAEYQQALEQLRQAGHLYACTCSRRQIREASANGRYPLTCRSRSLDFSAPQTAWRIRLEENARSIAQQEWRAGPQYYDLIEGMGDFVVRRKDKLPAYQLASLIDDSRWDINFIVRGKDLHSSSAAQLYLSDKLGLGKFQQSGFWHHDLITDQRGRKLSKSAGAAAMRHWRQNGKSPAPIIQMAAAWLGVPSEEEITASELVQLLQEKKLTPLSQASPDQPTS